MKKFGIVSCYYVKNYGSMLQAYAVQKMLDNKKIENENINYVKEKNIKQMISSLKRLCNKNVRKVQIKNLKKKIISKINKTKYGNNFKIRDEKFEEFKNKYIRASKPYYGYENVKTSAKDYDIFVLGSDQLWHPDNLYNHYFTLEFLPKNKTKMTYATSFGVASIPKKQEKITKEYLQNIQYIGVREQTGKEIIKKLTNRDVSVVLDPTLMLSKEEWDEIQTKEKLYDKKYIFCYFLGNNKKQREYVKKVKEQTGYDIVVLPHIDEIVKIDDEYADVQMYNVGPAEMINLVKNAELVFTDSFHCTIFSIMYEKKFFTFNRFNSKSKASTNTRLKSILGLLGLEDRFYENYEDVLENVNKDIDYELPKQKLNKLKEESFQYFDEAIENCLKLEEK